MARPRSIVGLLFHLVVLYVRRRPALYVAASCALIAALVWPRSGGERGAVGGGLQVGVLRDGFVVTHPAESGRRVIEIDRQGGERRVMAVTHGEDQRVVGTSVGTAVAWQEGKKLRLVRAEDDRDLGSWGKAVRQLCEGVASNDARFAVGWLESDDRVWIVHGPVAKALGESAERIEVTADLARNEWCGVASAEQNVAMFWRAADKLSFTFCTRRGCSGLGGTTRLDRRLPILGFGCVSNACLVAARDESGTARLAFLTETGRTKWVKPLDTPASTVSIIGIGDRMFAVGYATRSGAEVVGFGRDGRATSIWQDPACTAGPALAWSSDRLLIAHYHGDQLINETMPLQR